MIRKRTILSLALLASTAACGGGGGGGSAPAASGGAPAQAANPTGFSNPSVAASTDANGNLGTATMSTDGSQTATLDLSGDVNPAALLTITVPGFNHTFTLGGPDVTGLSDVTFNGVPIYNVADPNNADGTLTNFNIKTETNSDNSKDTVVFDVSGLTSSNYGIWSHADATGKTTAVGAFAAGTDTLASDMPQTGAATYQGGAVGTGSSNGANFNLTGLFTGNVDFGSRQVGVSLDMTASQADGSAAHWGTLSSNATITQGTNKYAGAMTSSGTPVAVNGTTSGAFYGLAAAEMGGVFAVSGSGTSAIGAYGGAKH